LIGVAAAALPPIVIGATGGSGTRVVHAALADAGVYLGANLNHAGDAMEFEPLLDDAINEIIGRTRALDYEPSALPLDTRRLLLARLGRTIDAYRCGIPAGAARWGWKNPRSMYILPLIAALHPDLTFIHVIRDGRDMALSDNQNQLNKHFVALFGRAADEPPFVDSIRQWARANRDVAGWGARRLGRRYVRVRLEDLCLQPMATLHELFGRIGLAGDLATIARQIRPPASLGRWRELPGQRAAEMAQAGADGLRAFGYV
jgi:hypothetical protein